MVEKIGTIGKVALKEMQDEWKYLDKETKAQLLPYFQNLQENKTKYNETEDEELKKQIRVDQYNDLNKIQSIIVANQGIFDKTRNISEETATGANKGLTEILGFPVDILNLAMFKGEDYIRKSLADQGFDVKTQDYKPFFSSEQPIGGSESIQKLFEHLGIRTEYDKSRASTAIAGRIGEEIGMTIPFFGYAAKTAQPGKTMLGELGLATTAGTAAALTQQVSDSPVAEAYATTLGYLGPMSLYKILPKQSVKDAFNVVFRPDQTAKNSASVVLANALLKDGKINEVQFDLLVNKLASGNTELLGTTTSTTVFPRLLDDITQDNNLEALKTILLNSPDSGKFIEGINNLKAQQNAVLETVFIQRLDEIASAQKGTEDVAQALLNKYPALEDYSKVRLSIAEENASALIQRLGDQVSPEIASSIYMRELQDALFDAQRMEKALYTRVTNKLPKSSIEEIKNGFQSIINNQLKTESGTSIPKIIEDVAGKEVTEELFTSTKRTKPLTQTTTVSLLDEINPNKSMEEILNLRNRLYDEIAKETQKGANASINKINNLKDAVGVVDSSIVKGFSAMDQNFFEGVQALDFSNTIRSKFYDNPDVGSVLGYNELTGASGVVNQQKLDKLINAGKIDNFVDALDETSKGLEQKYIQEFVNLADPNGKINAKILNAYIDKNSEALEKFPELKAQLADISTAQKLVDDVKNTTGDFGVTFNQLKKDRAKLLLKPNESDVTTQGLLNRGFKTTDIDKRNSFFNGLLDNVVDDTIAKGGLQDEVSEYFINTIKTKKVPAKGPEGKTSYTFDISETNKFLKENEDFLRQLYGDEGFDLMKTMEAELELINKQIKLPGSFEGMMTEVGKNNLFIGSIGRILGTQVAGLTGGPALVFAGIGGRLANNLIGNKTNNEIKSLLARAFQDPEFAAELLQPINQQLQDQKQRLLDGFFTKEYEVLTTPAGARATETTFREEDIEEQIEQQVPVNLPEAVETSSIGQTNIFPEQGMTSPMTMAAGQAIFGAEDPVFGGIMQTNVGRQRVA